MHTKYIHIHEESIVICNESYRLVLFRHRVVLRVNTIENGAVKCEFLRQKRPTARC